MFDSENFEGNQKIKKIKNKNKQKEKMKKNNKINLNTINLLLIFEKKSRLCGYLINQLNNLK